MLGNVVVVCPAKLTLKTRCRAAVGLFWDGVHQQGTETKNSLSYLTMSHIDRSRLIWQISGSDKPSVHIFTNKMKMITNTYICCKLTSNSGYQQILSVYRVIITQGIRRPRPNEKRKLRPPSNKGYLAILSYAVTEAL